MHQLKPEFLKKDGQTQFVILTAEDYKAVQEMIEDAQDVLLVREARARNGNKPGISLEEMKRRLGMKTRRKVRAG